MLPGPGINNTRHLSFSNAFKESTLLGGLILEGLYAQPDIGSIKTLHDHMGIAHIEAFQNLITYWQRSGSRQCQYAWMAQFLDDCSQPQIIGAEIMAPRTDAMRFINDKQRGLSLLQLLKRLFTIELFGSKEQKLEFTVFQVGKRLAHLSGGYSRINLGCAA